MTNWIVWVPFLPLISAAILLLHPLLSSKVWPERVASTLACMVLVVGFLITVLVAVQLSAEGMNHYSVELAQWFSTGRFSVTFGFYIDALTLVMMFIITGVGALIHWFSSAYMTNDDGYTRYFAYLNLFVSAMLILVMADSLLLLYLGWEGVGLCSCLLIGFWYQDSRNGYAARKAFVVTRIGDTAMAIGLLLLFVHLGSLDIQLTMKNAVALWQQNDGWATLCALLLLGGAVGKSAQLPLQTWLPDAMAGPTPVSALIHAATMVTAGVYLIARTHVLFELSTIVMATVAAIGAMTALIAACSALVQTDIKRILAYSTMSQIGYMFYALGVGAWSVGIFHLMTHAFFKALLFLTAGLLITSLHHQQNIFHMGGLRQRMPVAFWSFIVGCSALAAVPMTSGFFSKEAILLKAYEAGGVDILWLMAVTAAFITSVYSFRIIFVVFAGDYTQSDEVQEKKAVALQWPLFILCALALMGGWLEPQLSTVFEPQPSVTLPGADTAEAEHLLLGIVLTAITLLGILIAYRIWGKGRARQMSQTLRPLQRWWFDGWGFDKLYDLLLVRPLLRLCYWNRFDIIDTVFTLLAEVSHFLHRQFSLTQNGSLRWYAVATAAGAALILLIMVLL